VLHRTIGLLSLVLGQILASAAAAQEEAPSPAKPAESSAEQWQQHGWPLMRQFCLDCHNQDIQEGELDLTGFAKLGQGDAAGTTMQRVLEMVRFGAMPPDDAELPSDQQRKQLVTELDQALFAVSCDLRPRPGKVTARRLNRAEYNHSIRDIFGVDLRPADQFPSDEVGAGFDNNADVLSLSPTLIEKYLDAAEFVSQRVLIDPDSLPSIDKEFPSDQLLVSGETKTGRFNGRFLAPDAFAWFDVEVPVDGEYRIRIRCGNASKSTPRVMVGLFAEDGLLLDTHRMEYYGGGGSSKSFEHVAQLSKGKRRFFIEPIEDDQRELEAGKTRHPAFAAIAPDVIAAAEQRRKKPLKPDDEVSPSKFPFMLRSVDIEGPREHDKSAFPPSHFQILRRTARRERGRWRDVEQAAAECLQPLMRRAFRQRVTDEEVRPYAQLVKDATDRGESYYRGLQIAMSAVLVSPRFLFRVETPPEDWQRENEDDAVPLTQHQLATRLAYFLWSSTPDDQLLDDADNGRLDQDKIEQHVRRMIGDQKADALATQFAAQWLGLRNLAVHEADTEFFTGFDPQLADSMARETELLFMHIVRENKSVAELLTADYSFLNSDLARHYGIDHQSADFQRVSLKDSNRRGILSHGSILTFTSNPNRTSPVKRGKWILVNVLGTPPPDPPPGVPELEETKTADENATLREQLELHRQNATCASCHRVMDQLGFGLEQFDAIGRYREQESGAAVDASGVLPGGRKFNGAAELSQILADSERAAFARTAAERLLTFAIGRELTPSDRCTIDEIVQKTEHHDYRMMDLILEVVRSRPFQSYDWQPAR
jgi:hypothetical protein